MSGPADPPDAGLPQAGISEHDGVRYLHLGSPWVQGAMRLSAPARIELEYVQRMAAALLWWPPEAMAGSRAVHLGLGAGALARLTLQALRMDTTVVELNPEVVAACRAWFRLPAPSDRFRVHLGDALHWLREEGSGWGARWLTVDLYDQEAAAPVLDDEDFYRACRAVLDEDGLMSVNLFGRDAQFSRSAARIEAAFGVGRVWMLRPTREGNVIVLASRRRPLPERAVLLQRAAAWEALCQRQGLPARKWPRLLRPWASQASPPCRDAPSSDPDSLT